MPVRIGFFRLGRKMKRSPFPSNQLLGDVRGSGWSIPGQHNFGGAPKSYAGRSRNTIVTMSKKHFPSGWDESRVQQVLDHYETQSDEEAVADDEAAFESTTHTAVEVPVDLVPEVRELIAKHKVS